MVAQVVGILSLTFYPTTMKRVDVSELLIVLTLIGTLVLLYGGYRHASHKANQKTSVVKSNEVYEVNVNHSLTKCYDQAHDQTLRPIALT